MPFSHNVSRDMWQMITKIIYTKDYKVILMILLLIN